MRAEGAIAQSDSALKDNEAEIVLEFGRGREDGFRVYSMENRLGSVAFRNSEKSIPTGVFPDAVRHCQHGPGSNEG